MINYKQPLRIIAPISLIFIFGITACEKKQPPDNYTARVNDSYLTEAEIDEELENSLKFREEFVVQWIENELLAQEAEKNGILDREKYERIIEKSKKELAAALLLSDHFRGINPEIKHKTLLAYYELNSERF